MRCTRRDIQPQPVDWAPGCTWDQEMVATFEKMEGDTEAYIMEKDPLRKEEQPVSEFQPQHPQYWIVGFLVRLLAPNLLPLAPASLIYQGLGEGQWTMKAHWTTKDQIVVTFDRTNP